MQRGLTRPPIADRLGHVIDELDRVRRDLALATARMADPKACRVQATDGTEVAPQDYLRAYA